MVRPNEGAGVAQNCENGNEINLNVGTNKSKKCLVILSLQLTHLNFENQWKIYGGLKTKTLKIITILRVW